MAAKPFVPDSNANHGDFISVFWRGLILEDSEGGGHFGR